MPNTYRILAAIQINVPLKLTEKIFLLCPLDFYAELRLVFFFVWLGLAKGCSPLTPPKALPLETASLLKKA